MTDRRGTFWPLRRTTIAALLALVCLSIGLLAIHTAPVEVGLGGVIIIWIGAVPALLYLQGIERPPLPFLPYVGVFYIVFFGLPIFAVPLAYHDGDRVIVYQRYLLEVMTPGLPLLVASGVAGLVAVFYASQHLLFRRLQPFHLPGVPAPASVVNLLLWILAVASLSYRLLPFLRSLPSIGEFLVPAGYLALGGFYLQWRRNSLPCWQAVIAIIVVLPLDIYVRVKDLFLTDLILLAVYFGFVLWRAGQQKLISYLLMLTLVLISTYSATTAFRAVTDGFAEKVATTADRFKNVLEGPTEITQTAVDGSPMTSNPRLSPLINRVGQIWMLQMVAERTPDPVPYWQGATYRPLFTSFIPRALYPDKPQERTGAAFGYRYGFLENINDPTSFNLPWITELYANFGSAGVVIGMALFGFLLAALDRWFNANSMSDLEALIGLTILFRLGYQESNFSVMVGTLLPLFVALYAYFRGGAAVLMRLGFARPQS